MLLILVVPATSMALSLYPGPVPDYSSDARLDNWGSCDNDKSRWRFYDGGYYTYKEVDTAAG
ncbi:MAG: hypothetical protein G01um101448_442, partial [Parcubacteria group bacterium Gr01-1014_48]